MGPIRECFDRTSIALAIATALTLTSATADSSDLRKIPAPPLQRLNDASMRLPYAGTDHVAQHTIAKLPDDAIRVTNCDDSARGSLRDVLANVAANGDTVDLTQLPCSTITLTTGALVIDQNSITLQGPGPQLLSISGAGTQLDLYHRGTGQLTVNDLTVADGLNEQRQSAKGGCIHSEGYVALRDVVVRDCTVRTTSKDGSPDTLGGGAFANRGVDLVDTAMLDNTAAHIGGAEFPITDGGAVFSYGPITITRSYLAGNVSTGLGGAIEAPAGLQMRYTTISGNTAHYVGGVSALGDISIESSAIVDNTAVRVGGLAVGDTLIPTSIAVHNTTISGNTGDFASGVAFYGGDVEIANCTIAFNLSLGSPAGAGLVVGGLVLDLESSILAHNTAYKSGAETSEDLDGKGVVTGANNLVVAPLIDVPPGTIGDDPQLLALADNGGPTPTHALPSWSPALNRGNNLFNAAYDQRGAGFRRTVGERPDIGAFELLEDPIFASGFDF